MFYVAKADDTVYEDVTPHGDEDDDRATMLWNEQISSVQEEEKEYPVIRRRSRSVGSRPLFHRKQESPIAPNSVKYVILKCFTNCYILKFYVVIAVF